jgi:hypothetical protein
MVSLFCYRMTSGRGSFSCFTVGNKNMADAWTGLWQQRYYNLGYISEICRIIIIL